MKYILLILISVISISCSQQHSQKLDFLLGTWKVEGKEQFEKWELQGEDLIGIGYQIEDGQEKLMETLAIRLIDEELVYQATVANQNQGATISFPINTNVSELYSFENASHDFPKKIQYQLINSKRLKVNVLGKDDKGFTFFLNKIENQTRTP